MRVFKNIKIPKVLENATLYSGAAFLQKGIGFILLPFYTAYLTPEDYGIMNLLNSVIGFFSILILLSLNGAAARLHYKEEYAKKRACLWGTLLILVIINSLFWTGAAVSFHKYIIDPFLDGISFWNLTIFSLLNVFFSPLYLFFQQWLQTNEQGRQYSINMLVNFLLTTSLNIVFVAIFKMGVLGVLMSSLVSSLVFFVYSIIVFLPKVKLCLDKKIAKESYTYALPLVPHSIAGYLSVMLDRVLLNKLATASTLGIYSVANQFGSIVNYFTDSVNQAYAPWFMKECKNGTPDNMKINQMALSAISVYSYISMLITIFTPEVINVMTTGNSFNEAWIPVVFICYGSVFNAIYYFFSMPLFLSYTNCIMTITITRLLVNAVLNIILIPQLGYIGAGIAFCVSTIYESLIALILSYKKCTFVRFHFIKIYSVACFFLMISLCVFIIENLESVYTKLTIKALFVIITTYFCYRKYGKSLILTLKR